MDLKKILHLKGMNGKNVNNSDALFRYKNKLLSMEVIGKYFEENKKLKTILKSSLNYIEDSQYLEALKQKIREEGIKGIISEENFRSEEESIINDTINSFIQKEQQFSENFNQLGNLNKIKVSYIIENIIGVYIKDVSKYINFFQNFSNLDIKDFQYKLNKYLNFLKRHLRKLERLSE